MTRKGSLKEEVYNMIESGKSDALILRRADISEGSLRAYKANYTRQKKMGIGKNKLSSLEMHNIVYECKNNDVPNEAIYADPRMRGANAQSIAGHIAAWERDE